jgi:hypothetical protein
VQVKKEQSGLNTYQESEIRELLGKCIFICMQDHIVLLRQTGKKGLDTEKSVGIWKMFYLSFSISYIISNVCLWFINVLSNKNKTFETKIKIHLG